MPAVYHRQRNNLHPDAQDRAAVVRRAQAMGRRMRNQGRELCPVKTGWLRAHIDGRVQSRKRSVHTGYFNRVFYASFQDTGFTHTSGKRVPGRQFMARPWREWSARITRLIRDANRPSRRS